MDNNVIVIRSPQEIAAEINAIRRRAVRQLLEDSVEVGRLLTEAKSAVQHGEWGGWLEENFQYSSTEANNLMRLWEAYGTKEQLSLFEENRMDLFGRLNKSQAIALLGLPETERAAFVEANPPEDLSVREWEAKIAEARERGRQEAWEEWREDFEEKDSNLRAEIKRADEAVRRAVELGNAKMDAEKAAREAADKLAEASARAEAAENNAAEAEKLEKKLRAAQKLAEDRALSNQNTLREMAGLREEKEALQVRIDELEKNPVVEVREMSEEEKAAFEDRIRAEVGSEAETLRADLSALTAENRKLRLAADPVMQRFRRYFDDFREAYAGMKTVIAEAEAENEAETAENLTTALTRMIAAIREEWK